MHGTSSDLMEGHITFTEITFLVHMKSIPNGMMWRFYDAMREVYTLDEARSTHSVGHSIHPVTGKPTNRLWFPLILVLVILNLRNYAMAQVIETGETGREHGGK